MNYRHTYKEIKTIINATSKHEIRDTLDKKQQKDLVSIVTKYDLDKENDELLTNCQTYLTKVELLNVVDLYILLYLRSKLFNYRITNDHQSHLLLNVNDLMLTVYGNYYTDLINELIVNAFIEYDIHKAATFYGKIKNKSYGLVYFRKMVELNNLDEIADIILFSEDKIYLYDAITDYDKRLSIMKMNISNGDSESIYLYLSECINSEDEEIKYIKSFFENPEVDSNKKRHVIQNLASDFENNINRNLSIMYIVENYSSEYYIGYIKSIHCLCDLYSKYYEKMAQQNKIIKTLTLTNEELSNNNKILEQKIVELTYAPGGPGYLDAKNDFETYQKN